jgi:hypothetical protein
MKAIINGWYETDINEAQDQIYFDGDWYEVLTDMEGEFYFMYEDKAFYFKAPINN